MAYLNDNALDQGLNWVVANGTRLDACTQEPTTYAEATSTHSIGNRTGVTVGSPEDGDVDGRKVVVPATTGGSVTVTGTATHIALTDGSGVLVATKALSPSRPLVSGDTFDTDAFNITIRDAT